MTSRLRTTLALTLLWSATAHAGPWQRSAAKTLERIKNAEVVIGPHRTESPITRLTEQRFKAAKIGDAADRLSQIIRGNKGIDRQSLKQGIKLSVFGKANDGAGVVHSLTGRETARPNGGTSTQLSGGWTRSDGTSRLFSIKLDDRRSGKIDRTLAVETSRTVVPQGQSTVERGTHEIVGERRLGWFRVEKHAVVASEGGKITDVALNRRTLRLGKIVLPLGRAFGKKAIEALTRDQRQAIDHAAIAKQNARSELGTAIAWKTHDTSTGKPAGWEAVEAGLSALARGKEVDAKAFNASFKQALALVPEQARQATYADEREYEHAVYLTPLSTLGTDAKYQMKVSQVERIDIPPGHDLWASAGKHYLVELRGPNGFQREQFSTDEFDKMLRRPNQTIDAAILQRMAAKTRATRFATDAPYKAQQALDGTFTAAAYFNPTFRRSPRDLLGQGLTRPQFDHAFTKLLGDHLDDVVPTTLPDRTRVSLLHVVHPFDTLAGRPARTIDLKLVAPHFTSDKPATIEATVRAADGTVLSQKTIEYRELYTLLNSGRGLLATLAP